MKERDLMLDIETLDTSPKAVVLSVGLVRFNPVSRDIAEAAQIVLDLDEQLELGRVINPNTLRWWVSPDPKAPNKLETFRNQIAPEGAPPKNLADALSEIHDIAERVHRVWGNGVGFDNTILHSLSNDAIGASVWGYWKDRCFRTFARTFDAKAKLRKNAADHDALSDAKLQADWMADIIEHYGLQEHFT